MPTQGPVTNHGQTRSHQTNRTSIVCGPSNLYVLDLVPGEQPPPEWADARHDRDVLAWRAGQPYPNDTYSVRRPSPSEHLYFRVGEDNTLRNTRRPARMADRPPRPRRFIVAPASIPRDAVAARRDRRPAAAAPRRLHRLQPAGQLRHVDGALRDGPAMLSEMGQLRSAA
ncbi:bifunctional DNA primase/polymerase [Amycolatopsis nalaikhensis]|uniref:bifunctional DNA primase/polymerase n=1 Tax=Amycolatopsis nalaikhensis TaxID=715472 RepID=UPI003329FF3F